MMYSGTPCWSTVLVDHHEENPVTAHSFTDAMLAMTRCLTLKRESNAALVFCSRRSTVAISDQDCLSVEPGSGSSDGRDELDQ